MFFSSKAPIVYDWDPISDFSMSKTTHRYIQPQGRSYLILLAAFGVFLDDFGVLLIPNHSIDSNPGGCPGFASC